MGKKVPHPAWIEINLSQFRKNLGIIRSQLDGRLFCLPIKANAYGHGLTEIGRAAAESKVDYLAVAYLQEGVSLRLAGIDIPIVVLGAVHEDQIADLINYNLEFTISSKYKAELVHTWCQKLNKKCRIHVEIDTGMQRTGIRASSADMLFRSLESMPFLEVAGIYSHLATSDIPGHPFTDRQIDTFQEVLQHPFIKKTNPICHIANSGGLAHFPKSHRDMVRPGILSFGYLELDNSSNFEGIAPFFSLKAKVSYFKVVSAGQGISYGHTYTTTKQTRIITVPVGYGDGYRRMLSNKGSVLLRGKRFPIVGSICMDQFMVDVGDQEVYVGEEVTLIGKQGKEEITLNEIAKLCDTIPYEILCLFNDRIPRIYQG